MDPFVAFSFGCLGRLSSKIAAAMDEMGEFGEVQARPDTLTAMGATGPTLRVTVGVEAKEAKVAGRVSTG